jgi:hypothetical protein
MPVATSSLIFIALPFRALIEQGGVLEQTHGLDPSGIRRVD